MRTRVHPLLFSIDLVRIAVTDRQSKAAVFSMRGFFSWTHSSATTALLPSRRHTRFQYFRN